MAQVYNPKISQFVTLETFFYANKKWTPNLEARRARRYFKPFCLLLSEQVCGVDKSTLRRRHRVARFVAFAKALCEGTVWITDGAVA